LFGLTDSHQSTRTQRDGGGQLVEVNRGQYAAVGTLNHLLCVFLVLCFGAVLVLLLLVFHGV
jgi:hypothetical protein